MHKWRDEDRAYFRLYQIARADVEYILGTFGGVRDEDADHKGLGPTRALVLDAFDRYGQ